MKKLKKLIMAAISAVLAVTLILSTGISAYAESVKGLWYVGKVDDDLNLQHYGRKGSGSISVDEKVYSKGSRCSLKLSIDNGYDYVCAEKKVTLEPCTTYKFSAKVKYSGYKADPSTANIKSGAGLVVWTFNNNEFSVITSTNVSKSEEWTELSCIFTTGAKTKDYYLRLSNGEYLAKCRGTAWFSDVKLEKAKLTKDWNMLVVICKTVDTNVDLHNKTTDLKPEGKGKTHYKKSLNETDIKDIKKILNNTKKSFKTMSDGLVSIQNIDYVTIDTPITELAEHNTEKMRGYCLDFDYPYLSKLLDKHTKKKNYNQIVVVAPLAKIAGGWGGLGGKSFNGVNICQAIYDYDYFNSKSKLKAGFRESLFMHEILHGVNNISTLFDPDTPLLHENVGIYQDYYNDSDEWYKYYSDYMTRNLPDGRGADPRAFYRPNGKYTLVDGNMTVGGLIEPSKKFPIDISTLKVAKVADCSYTGKKIFPSVTLTDGDYTLKKGVDYTIACKNNVNIGTATVIIKGMGLYTGSVTKKFNIVKAKVTGEPPTVTASRKDNVIKISWSEVAGAESYIIWVSKDGGDFKKLKELDASKKSYSIKVNGKKGEYQYAVTAYIPEIKDCTKYVYTDKL